jgi:hypothetical protein
VLYPLSYTDIIPVGRIRTCDFPRQRRSNPCLHHRPDLISTTTPRQVAEKVSSRPAISPSAKTAADFAVLTARLKPRPFKTRSRPKFFRGPLFPLPLKACPDTSNGFSHGPNTAVFVLAGELSKRVRGRSFLVPWGCAPVPETQRLGRVRNPAWSFVRSNSLLSPPAKLYISANTRPHLWRFGFRLTDAFSSQSQARVPRHIFFMAREQQDTAGLAPRGLEPHNSPM